MVTTWDDDVLLRLPILITWDDEAKIFVATYPEFANLYSQGRSRKEALEALKDAAHMFFEQHAKRGTLAAGVK